MGGGGGQTAGNGCRLARAAGGSDPAAVWTGRASQGDAGGDRGTMGNKQAAGLSNRRGSADPGGAACIAEEKVSLGVSLPVGGGVPGARAGAGLAGTG